MLKKTMLGLMALCFAVALAAPSKASAQVAVGATIRPANCHRAYVDPYASSYYDYDTYPAYSNNYPAYSYDYTYPAYNYSYAYPSYSATATGVTAATSGANIAGTNGVNTSGANIIAGNCYTLMQTPSPAARARGFFVQRIFVVKRFEES
jgi:hypothetical protein